jgi:hypothetical protein
MKSSDGSWRNAAALSVVLVGLTLAGCSQHEGMPTAKETAAADQHLPFEATSDKGGISPTASLVPGAIPAGTPLAVHLRTLVSSATSRSGDTFEAVLDEPILVRGQTVAPRGAILAGKVLDARASGQSEDQGYMRLALTAISLDGKSLPIQTSSIFVKRGSHEKRNMTVISGASISPASTGAAESGMAYAAENTDVGVAPERRLIFRLAQPLPLDF